MVFRGHRIIPDEGKRRSTKKVGPRLGHHRQSGAASPAIGRVELARRQLELLERFGCERQERPSVSVVAIVGAIHHRNDIRPRRTTERHAADVLLAAVDRRHRRGTRQKRKHSADCPGNHGQVLDLGRLDARCHRRLRHLNQRDRAGDGDGFGHTGERQP